MDKLKKYIPDGEEVLWHGGYCERYLSYFKIMYIIFGVLLCWTIIFPLIFAIAYLKITSEIYVITNKRALIITGLLSKTVKDIPISKITDIQIHQPFFEKVIWKSGTMFLNTAGGNRYEGVLRYVSDPFTVKKHFSL